MTSPTSNLGGGTNPFQPPQEPSPRVRSRLWILAARAILGMCCCSGICLVPMGAGVYQAFAEKGGVERTVTAFFAEVDARNGDAALAHFFPCDSHQTSEPGAARRDL